MFPIMTLTMGIPEVAPCMLMKCDKKLPVNEVTWSERPVSSDIQY